MKTIDMHCDSIMYVKLNKEPALRNYDGAMVDFEKLKRGGVLGQFFAIFSSAKDVYLPRKGASKLLLDRFRWIYQAFEREMAANSDIIAQARSVSEILENDKKGLVSAILTMEDGAAVENDIENLKEFYDCGVRVYGFIWNFENVLAYPNSTDPEIMNKPLKPFGIEVLGRLNELGIAADVSHLNDGGFWDVVKYSKKPFFATHSNARALCPVERNLTDEQLRALGSTGSVAGLNYCSLFLHDRKDGLTTVDDIVRHAKYMVNLAGEDSVGLGSDYDGITNALSFGDVSGVQAIAEGLSKVFTPSQVEKICYKNVLRVLAENEKK